jgi:uncharacterized protein YegJ (DUF2314 family)
MTIRILSLCVSLLAITSSTVAFSMENNKSELSKPEVFIHYALFFGKQNLQLNSDELVKLCDFEGVERITDINSSINKQSILVKQQSVDELPVPSMQSLQYFGRGFDQSKANRIMESDYSVSFIGVAPFDKDHTLLKKITECVGGIASKYNAFVFDAADSLTFTSDSFEKLRLDEIKKGLYSASQFGVRAYRVEKGLRSVSMGLEKFGQPNLVIENFSEHHMSYMDKLFTMVLQSVIESPVKVTPGPMAIDIKHIVNPVVRSNLDASIGPVGTGKAKLVLKKAMSLDGDPSELLAISFKNSPSDDLWIEQADLLSSVFGRDRDVSSVPDSVSLESAIASAKMRVKSILDERHALEKDGMRLLVAVAMKETKEVVWVEVTEWIEQIGIGILLSNPIHTKSHSSGMKYKFNYESIMDYKLYGTDGLIDQGGVDELARQVGTQK